MSVIIYTTPICVFCKMTKQFFRDNDVEFTEIDVAKDEVAREKMFESSGQMGVPVIDIDGKIVVGFNRPKLAELLNFHA